MWIDLEVRKAEVDERFLAEEDENSSLGMRPLPTQNLVDLLERGTGNLRKREWLVVWLVSQCFQSLPEGIMGPLPFLIRQHQQ